jgi:hypothetical protein
MTLNIYIRKARVCNETKIQVGQSTSTRHSYLFLKHPVPGRCYSWRHHTSSGGITFSCWSNPSFLGIQYNHILSHASMSIPLFLAPWELREPSSYSDGLRAGRPGDLVSIPGKGKRFFSFSTASKPALGPTQPPTQWVPGDGVKQPGREADIHVMPRSRTAELYLHSLRSLHGVVIN